jgi:uncharacterized OB-fold protein
MASRDVTTGEIVFPPLAAESPLAARHEPVALAAEGSVYSYTVIHPGARSGLAPHALAYVDLPGPVRIFGRLQIEGRPQIGAPCTVKPDSTYGYVFEAHSRGAQV